MLCIIQARFSSKRLYGKVLKKISGITILERVYNQVKKSKKIKKIIIATSEHKLDKKIINFCKKKKIKFFLGPLNNVFKRFYLAIKDESCKNFIRISADSPFLDSRIIDLAINIFNKNRYDIVTNVFPRTFPKGFSVEILNSKIILKNFLKIIDKNDQEHLTSFFYKNHSNFKIKNFLNKIDLSHVNLSINTKEDLLKARKLLKFLKFKNMHLDQIVKIYKNLFIDNKLQ